MYVLSIIFATSGIYYNIEHGLYVRRLRRMHAVNIQLPCNVEKILSTLTNAGYEAFVVGGCVRDSLLELTPKDWDITTSALPEQVKELFSITIDTGIKHGTVTVVIDKSGYEVTTYRIDGEYSNNRHPDKITFSASLEDDVSRRDFTINQICYSPDKGLVDYYHGIEDLQNGIIRCIGNPDKRFQEDALRMLRAIRFAACYGFTVEDHTKRAIARNSHLLQNISKERIRDEVLKILLSARPSGYIRELTELGLMRYIIPELLDCKGFPQDNPYHDKDVLEHILMTVDNTPSRPVLRLSALLHDIGKPHCKSVDEQGIGHFYGHNGVSADMTRQILNRLRFDNETVKRVTCLVKFHDIELTASGRAVKRLLRALGYEVFEMLLDLKYADITAQNPKYLDERISLLNDIRDIVKEIMESAQCFTVKDLDINGYDLMELGFKGREIGEQLNWLLERVIDDHKLNKKSILIDLIKSKAPNRGI